MSSCRENPESSKEKRQYFLYLNATTRTLTVQSAPRSYSRMPATILPTDSTALQAQHYTNKLPAWLPSSLSSLSIMCNQKWGHAWIHSFVCFGFFEGYIKKEPHLCNRRWPHGNQGNSAPVKWKTPIIGNMTWTEQLASCQPHPEFCTESYIQWKLNRLLTYSSCLGLLL